MTFCIIVARYNENIEWTKQFENVIIYNKGSNIENEYNELPFIFQQFYKIKKEDLKIAGLAPQFINTTPELIAAKKDFDASQFRNQLGVNQDNRVGGNRRKMNKKIKTNKKRKQRMRKTKHKW